MVSHTATIRPDKLANNAVIDRLHSTCCFHPVKAQYYVQTWAA